MICFIPWHVRCFLFRCAIFQEDCKILPGSPPRIVIKLRYFLSFILFVLFYSKSHLCIDYASHPITLFLFYVISLGFYNNSTDLFCGQICTCCCKYCYMFIIFFVNIVIYLCIFCFQWKKIIVSGIISIMSFSSLTVYKHLTVLKLRKFEWVSENAIVTSTLSDDIDKYLATKITMNG